MDKKRFKNISVADELKIGKERRIFSSFSIAYIIFMVLGIALDTGSLPVGRCISGYLQSLPFNVAMNIPRIFGIFGLLAAGLSIISLKRLTKLVYNKSVKYFITYLIFMLLGFEFYIPIIVILLVIWFETRELFMSKNHSLGSHS